MRGYEGTRSRGAEQITEPDKARVLAGNRESSKHPEAESDTPRLPDRTVGAG